jgi:hypothetical protein
MEVLFELIIEILVQGGAELIIEILYHMGVRGSSSYKKPHPVLGAILWFFAGAITGGISVLVLPYYFLHNHTLRVAYLFLVPLLLGALMAFVGKTRTAKGQDIVPLDKFTYAALFAFGMALVRFYYTIPVPAH